MMTTSASLVLVPAHSHWIASSLIGRQGWLVGRTKFHLIRVSKSIARSCWYIKWLLTHTQGWPRKGIGLFSHMMLWPIDLTELELQLRHPAYFSTVTMLCLEIDTERSVTIAGLSKHFCNLKHFFFKLLAYLLIIITEVFRNIQRPYSPMHPFSNPMAMHAENWR